MRFVPWKFRGGAICMAVGVGAGVGGGAGTVAGEAEGAAITREGGGQGGAGGEGGGEKAGGQGGSSSRGLEAEAGRKAQDQMEVAAAMLQWRLPDPSKKGQAQAQ